MYETIGEQFKQRREDLGIKQMQLAYLIGCSQMTISNFETGNRGTTLTTVEKIASILKLKLLVVPTNNNLQKESS